MYRVTLALAMLVFAAEIAGAQQQADTTATACEDFTAPSARIQQLFKPQTTGSLSRNMSDRIIKSEDEWRKQLSPEEFRILREKGTERAFTGKYYQNKETGKYVCAACGAELFGSDAKFESGTGWPSFYNAVEGSIEMHTDTSHGMTRTEIMCAKCGGHLGHLFDDGPKPSGLRYCVNSASLSFRKTK